jgi:hypothetical protein
MAALFRVSVKPVTLTSVMTGCCGANSENVVVADDIPARFAALIDTDAAGATTVPIATVASNWVFDSTMDIPVPSAGYVHTIGSVFATATDCGIVITLAVAPDVSSVMVPLTGAGLSVPSAGVSGVNTSYEIAVAAFPTELVALFVRANAEAAGRRTAVVSIVNVRAAFVCVEIVTPAGRLPVSDHVIVPVSAAVCVMVTVFADAVST